MSAARALGAIYVATASVFGVAIALNQHPDWQRAAGQVGGSLVRLADHHVVQPAAEAGRHQLVRLFDAIDPPRIASRATPSQPRAGVAAAPQPDETIARQIEIDALLAKKKADAHLPAFGNPHAAMPEIATRDLGGALAAQPHDVKPLTIPPPPLPALQPVEKSVAAASPAAKKNVASVAPATGGLRLIPPPLAPATQPFVPSSSADVERVVDRLKGNLTEEMFRNFSLFLYVSKATDGPLAQHMYVFDKGANGDLTLKYDWPVSTGRERVEFNAEGARLPSFTPQGYYELDPDRIYRHYTSSQWHQPMPYAMFFNWVKEGSKTGLAIHAATGPDIALLGQRASAGCIRLDPANARILFSLIRAHYHGLAPRFAVNRRTGTMSNGGILLHDANGRLQMSEGYKVLVFIENYGGKDNVVAALF